MTRRRAAVWIGTLATAQVYAGLIWLMYEGLLRPRVRDVAMGLALAFAAAQAVVILIMLAALFMRRQAAWRAALRSELIRSEIEETLALQLVGVDRLPDLERLTKQSRTDVARAFDNTLATVRGAPREKLLQAARSLGLPAPTDALRIEARFTEAARGTLLQRAMIIEELEPFAADVVPEIGSALGSSDPARVAAALDMIYGWRRVLPVRGLDPLLHHGDESIRVRAFRAYPYVAQQNESAVVAGLRDPSPAVRAAAAATAGRLRAGSAAPALEKLLEDPVSEVAVAAAFALALLPDGQSRLQRAVASPDRAAAAVAFEALEKASIGRLEMA